MLNIPAYKQYNDATRIALMDNSSIAFLEKLECYSSVSQVLLRDYDAIIIPNWVFAEIKDSPYRINYLTMLLSQGYPIYYIAEEDYGALVNWEEGNLYKIVNASVSNLGVLKSYLRRNVYKDDPLDMSAYSQWISDLYANWPLSDECTGTGRTKKKNAGEISLTILAEIFAFYYSNIDTLTIYTQDRDTYEYQTNAHMQLRKLFCERIPLDVGFKSNDCLLSQLYRSGIIPLSKIEEMRKDERVVTYTRKMDDESVTLITKKLNNNDFVKLLQNDGTQIVF